MQERVTTLLRTLDRCDSGGGGTRDGRCGTSWLECDELGLGRRQWKGAIERASGEACLNADVALQRIQRSPEETLECGEGYAVHRLLRGTNRVFLLTSAGVAAVSSKHDRSTINRLFGPKTRSTDFLLTSAGVARGRRSLSAGASWEARASLTLLSSSSHAPLRRGRAWLTASCGGGRGRDEGGEEGGAAGGEGGRGRGRERGRARERHG